MTKVERDQSWPALPYHEWSATAETLRLWMQIVGKVRLSLSPWVNHSWHVTLYVTARGLTTSPIPHGSSIFELAFDFIDHRLELTKSDGTRRKLALRPRTVAEFYRELMQTLQTAALPVTINRMPNEITEVIPFDKDDAHSAYDPERANRFWRVLVQADRVFKEFRSRFCGKCSPVHFFWGSFDLAVTRFSGRPAPPHPGGVPHLPDSVAWEAYAQEVSSLGFWPGDANTPASFYSYAYPAQSGFEKADIGPKGAYWSPQLREFLLPYDIVRNAASPDEALLEFAQTTYDAASTLAQWDRDALDENNLRPPQST